jgi:YgiT-type zinc finger domain-containing protein
LSSPSTSAEVLCESCGSQQVHLKRVTRNYGKAADLLVIESIPMWSCPACGAPYFTAQTMHEIERITALRMSVAKSRPVPVAAFVEAAA